MKSDASKSKFKPSERELSILELLRENPNLQSAIKISIHHSQLPILNSLHPISRALTGYGQEDVAEVVSGAEGLQHLRIGLGQKLGHFTFFSAVPVCIRFLSFHMSCLFQRWLALDGLGT